MSAEDRIPIIAVDFDGTLDRNEWPRIGEPNMGLIDLLARLRAAHKAYVILWTCREGENLTEAVEACREWGLEFDAVNDNLPFISESFGGNSRKIFANYYIDDKARYKCAEEMMRND